MSLYQMTEREQDVTRLVLQGQSAGEIAARLFVSVREPRPSASRGGLRPGVGTFAQLESPAAWDS